MNAIELINDFFSKKCEDLINEAASCDDVSKKYLNYFISELYQELNNEIYELLKNEIVKRPID